MHNVAVSAVKASAVQSITYTPLQISWCKIVV